MLQRELLTFSVIPFTAHSSKEQNYIRGEPSRVWNWIYLVRNETLWAMWEKLTERKNCSLRVGKWQQSNDSTNLQIWGNISLGVVLSLNQWWGKGTLEFWEDRRTRSETARAREASLKYDKENVYSGVFFFLFYCSKKRRTGVEINTPFWNEKENNSKI